MKDISSVAVIGLGYIGLPTAAILAENGTRVFGVDVNQKTVDAVNAGQVPFVEPDLGEFVERAVAQGLLSASTQTPAADAYIVAVPTPFTEDMAADLSYIEAAGRSLAPQLVGGELIILESPPPLLVPRSGWPRWCTRPARIWPRISPWTSRTARSGCCRAR